MDLNDADRAVLHYLTGEPATGDHARDGESAGKPEPAGVRSARRPRSTRWRTQGPTFPVETRSLPGSASLRAFAIEVAREYGVNPSKIRTISKGRMEFDVGG